MMGIGFFFFFFSFIVKKVHLNVSRGTYPYVASCLGFLLPLEKRIIPLHVRNESLKIIIRGLIMDTKELMVSDSVRHHTRQ